MNTPDPIKESREEILHELLLFENEPIKKIETWLRTALTQHEKVVREEMAKNVLSLKKTVAELYEPAEPFSEQLAFQVDGKNMYNLALNDAAQALTPPTL